MFVLFSGDTLVLLDKVVNNAGDYLSGFVGASFDTYAFADEGAQEWTFLIPGFYAFVQRKREKAHGGNTKLIPLDDE